MPEDNKFHAVPEESHAQELLASERTFLSWIRTSIAVLTFGFAIIKFSVESWVGMAMIVFGGLLSGVGAFHYLRTNKQILEGKVESSNWLALSISASIVVLSIAVIIYLTVDAAKK